MITTLTKKCLRCGEVFSKPSFISKKQWFEKRKYCSKYCTHPQKIRFNCLICYKETIVRNYRKETAKYCSHFCEKIAKRSNTPTYNAIHKWINFQLGSPKKCNDCGFVSKNSRQFHWANISKKYLRDTSDWVRLCVKCHHKWDKKGILPECVAKA